MTITVRLEKTLHQKLKRLAAEKGLTKSDLVRECLLDYLARQASGKTPWELGKDLFGRFKSGRFDLSTRHKEIVREKVHAQAGHRRRRAPGGSLRPRR